MNQNTDTRLPQAVIDIGKIHFTGNVIPHEWYSHLRLDSNKPDLTAIVILSEIVYWYRPQRHLSEDGTGVTLTKKFQGDLLQTNAAYYEHKFGLTKDQTRKALKRLEDQGLIRREYREIDAHGIRLVNRMFIEPVPAAVLAMTHPHSESSSGSVPPDSGDGEVSPSSNTPSPGGNTPSLTDQTLSPESDTLSSGGDTNTKTTTEITTKTSTEISKKISEEEVGTQIVVDDNHAELELEPATSPSPSTTTATKPSDAEDEKVKPKRKKKTPPYPIPDDWQPSQECIARLERHGISRDFADILVDEFVLYWQARGICRPGWDSSFFNHAKRQWERHHAKTPVSEPTLDRGTVGNSTQMYYNYGGYHETSRRNNQPERLSAAEKMRRAGLRTLAEDGDIEAQRELFELEGRSGVVAIYGRDVPAQVVLKIGGAQKEQPCVSDVALGARWDNVGADRTGHGSLPRLRR